MRVPVEMPNLIQSDKATVELEAFDVVTLAEVGTGPGAEVPPAQ